MVINMALCTTLLSPSPSFFTKVRSDLSLTLPHLHNHRHQLNTKLKQTTTTNAILSSTSGRLCSSSLNTSFLRTQEHKSLSISRRNMRTSASRYLAFSTETSRWIFAVSALVLMLTKNAKVHKNFLVPMLALGAPTDLISWIRGEYGLWTAFVIFVVRLFYYIPGELELPFLFVIFAIITPLQLLSQRGTQLSVVITIASAAYLCFQQFKGAGGSVNKCFEQGNVVPSIASLFLLIVPLLVLVQGLYF